MTGEMEEVFEGLSDRRSLTGQQHSLHDILVIALCTILCGGQTCTGMAWFGQAKREFLGSFGVFWGSFLRLGNGIPSHDTFSRVFRGYFDCWTRRRFTPGFWDSGFWDSGFWDSWTGWRKAARGWWPGTVRRCAVPTTGRYDRAVRPGGRRVTPASGQCLGCGTKAGAGPNGRCWQRVQRDNREITAR